MLSYYFPENNFLLYNPKKSKEILFVPNETNVFERNPLSSFYKKHYNIWRQGGITNDLKKDQVELFHGLSGELPAGLKGKGIKSIVTIHDLIFLRYPHLYSFFDRKIHYYKFRKSAKNADLIIAISEQTKQDIIQFLDVESSKIKVIYQGCNGNFKRNFSAESKKEVAQKFDLPEKFVLNVGTIEERKNALTIVKAIKNLDINLVLIGKETKYSQQIRDYIKANNLQNRVHFLKGIKTEELAIIYQLASVFVYPSIFEGFGIPIIESFKFGCPLLCSNASCFPEIAGDAATYFNPKDNESIANAIINILENEKEAKMKIDKGYKKMQKYTLTNFQDKVLMWYNNYQN
jgi:glycosyltransferase involved in cell wall biosynthesis